MPDVAELIRETRPPVGEHSSLDVQRLMRRGRRRAAVRRSAAIAAVVVVVAVAVPLAARLRTPVDTSVTLLTPASPERGGGLSAAQAEAWNRLTTEQAARRLIALSERFPGPVLPPVAGEVARFRTIYVTEEVLPASTGADWSISESVRIVDAQGEGGGRFGSVTITAPTATEGRTFAVEQAARHRPQLTHAIRDTETVRHGYSWPDRAWLDGVVARTDRELTRNGSWEVESASAATWDTATRLELLRLIVANKDTITYEGLLTDLAGREAVAFTAGHDGDPTSTATILFSPEDASPRGWEYGGQGTDWRMETLISLETLAR